MRFSRGFDVSGYDPAEYLRQYRAAGSDVNAMRRIDYAARKDAINAQKRAAYAVQAYRKERIYKLGVTRDNVGELSDYAARMYHNRRFDEVEAEYKMRQLKNTVLAGAPGAIFDLVKLAF